jgi:hypothetical protein
MRSLVLGAARLVAAVVVPSVAALVLPAVAGRAPAAADSLNDLLGPREVAVGEALRGSATGASAIGLNPAGLPLNRELVFEGGYAYRAADSASLIGVSACDSTNAMPGCFFYNYAGSNPELGDMTMHRTTHVGGLALSRMIAPRLLFGTTAKYYRFSSDMVGESDGSGTTFDIGATLRLTRMINVGASWQNLWATNDSPQFPRAIGGGFYAHPVPSFAISFDARWLLDGERSVRYGGGAELFLRGDGGQSGFALRGGGLHDNALEATYVSAGLGYASQHWGVDIAGRREVKGGDETMVIGSLRFFGPRQSAPAIE